MPADWVGPPDSYYEPPDDEPCCYCECEGDDCACEDECECECEAPEPDFEAILEARFADRYGY